MGSDLYVSVEVRNSVGTWSSLFEGPSCALARGIIVDAFGGARSDGEYQGRTGYLIGNEVRIRAEHPECPWRLYEPYWVRSVDGREFCAIVRERRWRTLQDGDYADLECGPELRAYASMIESLLADGQDVRVWCWHSQ